MSFVWTVVAARGSSARSEEEVRAGEKIYQELCVVCHGSKGQGTSAYPKPLTGDLSILELTRIIDKTMPEEAPEDCVGEDARRVAEYVHGAFYSPTAQARNAPPRIELSRLTVRQYQQVVADLIGGLKGSPSPVWGETHGLRGEYFRKRRIQDGNRVFERVDPRVQFDFGEASPDDEKFEPSEFSIRWEGSVLAPETGDYEFIVRTEHATRLWVNDSKQALIDAWVKSGNDTEYRGTIRLLGGRPHGLRLEYSKAKQGVDDSKDQKEPAKRVKSSIALLWCPPRGIVEVIPERQLSPQRVPEVFVVEANFPPDDRSMGYERGTSVSKAWEQATTGGAIYTAEYIRRRHEELAGVSDSAPDCNAKLRAFSQRLAERAFRRPLNEAQQRLYVDRRFDGAATPADGVTRVALLLLKSPRFLYREPQTTGGDAWDVASRLSFGMWDSLPDQELLRAAKAGQLTTREQVLAQAERMLKDLRTHSKLREFFLQWLKVDQVAELSKDSQLYPDFNPQLAHDLRTSLELFIDETVWGEGGDFRRLLLADSIPMNGALAKFYGVDLPADAPFQRVSVDAAHRAGVLTHPFLLSNFAYNATSSPIHRGVFISRSLLGRVLRPPPEAVAPLAPELQPDLTTRERVDLQTRADSCLSCHGMINPLGFTLENFDAVGRFRSEEKGKPIDASGGYISREGQQSTFANVRELATFLAACDETHSAFVEQLFHYLVKQPIRAYGPERIPQLKKSFAEHGFNVRRLVVEIVASSAQP